MLSFKEFLETKSKIPAVFMQAGGPKNYNIISRNVIKESDSHSTQILQDPSQDNTGVGSEANDHEKLIEAPTNSPQKVSPNLSNQQAHHYKALAANTDRNQPEYRSTVENYTKGSSRINRHLYDAHVNETKTRSQMQGIKIKTLDDLIARHKTPHDMEVYTGPHFNPEEHAGKVVEAPAYTSTSLTPHVAKDFGVGNHILRVHLPAGHPHLFMDHESRFQGQSEVVLPRNTRFKIAEKPSHVVSGKFREHCSGQFPYEGNHQFWDAHIVPEEKSSQNIPSLTQLESPHKINDLPVDQIKNLINTNAISPKHIASLLDHTDESVRTCAVRSTKCNTTHLTKALNDSSEKVRKAAIGRAKCDQHHITKALDDPSEEVRIEASKHPKFNSDHITKALDDSSEEVRSNAVSHHNSVTSDHITKALDDPSKYVRAHAVWNYDKRTSPNSIKSSHIEKALSDPSSYVVRSAERAQEYIRKKSTK